MKKAIYWFKEAAFKRYAPAQTELGIMYHYGIVATTMRLEVFGGEKRCSR
jgi:TPR repeat protein